MCFDEKNKYTYQYATRKTGCRRPNVGIFRRLLLSSGRYRFGGSCFFLFTGVRRHIAMRLDQLVGSSYTEGELFIFFVI
jgi:hypothetical protein